jgi:ketosteroid isomerase-like protein
LFSAATPQVGSEPKFDTQNEPCSGHYLSGRGFLPNATGDPADDRQQAQEADPCKSRFSQLNNFVLTLLHKEQIAEGKMSDLDQINALDSGVAEGINGGDAAAISECYTNDAAILPPGAGRMDGKEAIQAYWQGGIDAGLSDVSITATSVDVTGDASVTVGMLSGKMGDAALTGKYIVIGKKTDEGWKIHRDIWNFDA